MADPRSTVIYAGDSASYITLSGGAFFENTNAGYLGDGYIVLPPFVFGSPAPKPTINYTFWWDGLTGLTTPSFEWVLRYANWGDIFNSSGFNNYINGFALGGGHYPTSGNTPGYTDPTRFRYFPTSVDPTQVNFNSIGHLVVGWNTYKLEKFDGTYSSHVDLFISSGTIPTAHIVTSGSILVGQNIDFDLPQTFATEGRPTSWLWNFGDGSPTDSNQTPSHTYAVAGIHTISVTVNIGHLGNQTFTLSLDFGPLGGGGGGTTDFTWVQNVPRDVLVATAFTLNYILAAEGYQELLSGSSVSFGAHVGYTFGPIARTCIFVRASTGDGVATFQMTTDARQTDVFTLPLSAGAKGLVVINWTPGWVTGDTSENLYVAVNWSSSLSGTLLCSVESFLVGATVVMGVQSSAGVMSFNAANFYTDTLP